MSITANIPQTPQGGPAAVQDFALIPLGQLSSPQANNAFTIYLNGALTVSIENRSNAAIMVQFLPYTAQMTNPFVRFIDPGVERTFSWQWPLEALVLSNLTVSPLPLNIGNALFPTEPAQQNITTGFILVSWSNVPASYAGMDQNIITGNTIIPTALQQVALDSGIAPAGTTTNYHETITEDINGLMLLLENSANVSSVSVSGLQTGTPYYAQAGPYTSVIALPVASAYDSTIDLSITMPAGETCQWYLIGRRDSVLDAVAALDLPPASVTVANQPTSYPVENVPGGTVLVKAEAFTNSVQYTATWSGTTGTVDESALAVTDLFGLAVLGVMETPSSSVGPSVYTFTVGVHGIQSGTRLPLIATLVNNQGTTANDFFGSVPVPIYFPYPLDIAAMLPSDTTWNIYVNFSLLSGSGTFQTAAAIVIAMYT